MTTPQQLTEDRYPEYLGLRERMLREEPGAYWSSPEDDTAQQLDEFRKLMSKPENAIFVIDVAGALVATSAIYRFEKIKGRHRAHIWGVFCAAEHRGHGYGKAAVRACVEHARTWSGVEWVTLSVSASGRAALHVYESLGFKRWGTEPEVLNIGGERFDEHHLSLRL